MKFNINQPSSSVLFLQNLKIYQSVIYRLIQKLGTQSQRFLSPSKLKVSQEWANDNFRLHQSQVFPHTTPASSEEWDKRVRFLSVGCFRLPSVRVEHMRIRIVFGVVHVSYNIDSDSSILGDTEWTNLDVLSGFSSQGACCRRPHSQTLIQKFTLKLQFLK